ncbi:MAG: mechanosensitive ion channel domain-containing protein [Paraglaciecola chathamensis]
MQTSSIFTFWIRFSLLLCLAFSTASYSDDDLLPSVEEIQQRLNASADAADISEQEKEQIEKSYQQAIDDIRAAQQYEQQSLKYRQAIKDAPDALSKIEQQQARYSAPKLPNEPLNSQTVLTLLNDMEGKVTSLRASTSELKANLDDERRLLLRQIISDTQTAIDATNNNLSTDEKSNPSQLADNIAQTAQRKMLQSKIDAVKQRLAYRPDHLALLEAQISLEQKKLNGAINLRDKLTALQSQLDSKANASKLSQLQAVTASLISAPKSLRDIAKHNELLAQRAASLSEQQENTSNELSQIQTQINELNNKFSSLNRLLELEVYESSAVFGNALRQEWEQTSSFINGSEAIKQTEMLLVDNRVAMFSINQKRAPYDVPEVNPLMTQIGKDNTRWKDEAHNLINQRRELISQLSSAYTQHVDTLSVLLDKLGYLSQRSKTYSDLLESNLFWIPSATPFNLQTIAAAGDSAAWLFRTEHWQNVVQAIARNVQQEQISLLTIVCAFVLTIILRKRLKQRLTDIAPNIGKVQTDAFQFTLEGLAITLGLALPPALLLFALALLSDTQTGFSNSLSNAFFVGGLMMIYLEFMLQLVRKNGLGEVHFRWSESNLALLRKNNRLLIIVFIPVGIIMTLLTNQASVEIREDLGQFALIILCASLAIAGTRVTRNAYYRHRTSLYTSKRFSYFVYSLLILVPVFLIILSAIGYQYSAQRILALMLETAVLCTLALLVYYTAERAISVKARRIAFEKIRAKRAATLLANEQQEAAEQSGEGVPDIIDTQELDRHTITSQTKAVIRLIIWLVLLGALSIVWQDISPIAYSLDDVVMWEISSDDPNTPAQLITLWSCLLSLGILFISVIGVRNLPGLLEMTVLGRLNLSPGTSYAITTMLKYTIVIVGIIVSVNILGAQWSKLQWLIAALGVGLGFGLQEIVANFVSGIVILFERPIRLGDTITIAGHSGTVTRIRIRATTVSDWDRKELIIPNKTFITQDFINWTLSDPVTRIVIPVGVVYGSDTEKVVSVLLNEANNNHNVYDDPAPAALFLAFSTSSLLFELRVFARAVVDRAMVTHELHMQIEKAFKQAGIEIAYPQQDVHINMRDPIDINIATTKPDDQQK